MTAPHILARPRPGVVGETSRVTHLFPVPNGDGPIITLTAYCGTTFGAGDLEQLDRITGMPCERCLIRSPQPVPHRPCAEHDGDHCEVCEQPWPCGLR